MATAIFRLFVNFAETRARKRDALLDVVNILTLKDSALLLSVSFKMIKGLCWWSLMVVIYKVYMQLKVLLLKSIYWNLCAGMLDCRQQKLEIWMTLCDCTRETTADWRWKTPKDEHQLIRLLYEIEWIFCNSLRNNMEVRDALIILWMGDWLLFLTYFHKYLDLDAQDLAGNTPLHLAVENGSLEALECLLEL